MIIKCCMVHVRLSVLFIYHFPMMIVCIKIRNLLCVKFQGYLQSMLRWGNKYGRVFGWVLLNLFCTKVPTTYNIVILTQSKPKRDFIRHIYIIEPCFRKINFPYFCNCIIQVYFINACITGKNSNRVRLNIFLSEHFTQ